MKKIIGLICMFIILSGCTQMSSEKTMVCEGISSNIIKVKNTVVYKGDKVLKQTIENKATLEDLGVDKNMLEALVEKYSEAYLIDGVKYTYTIEDGVFLEMITVDFETANFDELKKVGLVEVEEEGEVTEINFDKTKKALEDFGMTCNTD